MTATEVERGSSVELEKGDPGPGVSVEKDYGSGKELPEYTSGPVVGGGIEVAASALRELRRPIPTARQGFGGKDAGGFWSSFRSGTTLTKGEPDLGADGFNLEKKPPKPPMKQRLKENWDAADPRKVTGPKTPLYVFALINALGGLDDQVLGLIGPELRIEFGVSAGSLVLVQRLTGYADRFTNIPLAHLTDRIKKRVWLVQLSSVGTQIGSLLKPFATSMTTFTLYGMIPGYFGRLGGTARYTLMTDWYPSRDRARVFAFNNYIGRILGFLPTQLIVGLLVTTSGWRAALFFLGIVAVVVNSFTIFLKEPVRGGLDRLELGASPKVAAKEQKPPSFSESFRGVWNIKTQRRNLYGQVLGMFGSGLNTVMQFAMASNFQMDAFQRSLLAVVTQVGGVITMFFAAGVGGKMLIRRPGDYVVFTSLMGMVQFPMMIAQAFAPNPFIFILPNMAMGLIGMALAPVGMTITALSVPSRMRGMGMSIMSPLMMITAPISAGVTGMAERIGFQQGIMLFAPFVLAENLVRLSTATTIEADIRAARAAAMAAEDHEVSVAAGREKIVICRDVDIAYNRVATVFNVDFEVMRGEIVAVLGTNGAGKSTLLKAVAGLMVPDNGSIFIDGIETTFLPTHHLAQRGVIFVPGGHSVFPTLTVKENLVTATWMRRKGETETIDEQIAGVLDWFPRLRERLDVPGGALSGGEQQMLSLAQAFLMQPRLLIIDELTLGLAPTVVEQLLGILRQLREKGTTIVLVEQSLNLAATIADRAVYMINGRIAFEGTMEELMRQPELVQAVFMGRGVTTKASRGRASLFTEADRVLACEGIVKRFGGVTAVQDVSLEVRAGEVLGIIGPNGAGKTTMFDILAGTTVPDEGVVTLDGKDITMQPSHARARRGLGRVFQRAHLFPAMTVRETLMVALERRSAKSAFLSAIWAPSVRSSEARLRYRVNGYLELFELEGYAENFIHELSTGTRRAVEIACVMAAEPRVILLDEPTSGLAQAEVDAMGPSLTQLAKDTDCALVVIEHDLPFISTISDRLIAMKLGEIQAQGTPHEVLNDPAVIESHLAASAAVLNRSSVNPTLLTENRSPISLQPETGDDSN